MLCTVWATVQRDVCLLKSSQWQLSSVSFYRLQTNFWGTDTFFKMHRHIEACFRKGLSICILKIGSERFMEMTMVSIKFLWFASNFGHWLRVVFAWCDKQLMCISADGKSFVWHTKCVMWPFARVWGPSWVVFGFMLIHVIPAFCRFLWMTINSADMSNN